MRKPIYILGTGLSHDGSTCLMKDGKIIVSIEKERLTRKKHDGFNDNKTIQYCLDAAGISFKDIDLIVEESTVNTVYKPQDLVLRGNRNIPDDIPRVVISHHLAHVYSAIGTSPFNDMGVVVMDGQGCSLDDCKDVTEQSLPEECRNLKDEDKVHYWEKESYYLFENGRLTPVVRDFSKFKIWNRDEYPIAPNDMEHSIAELYGGASYYVFNKQFNEGKLMGLAPYGKPNVYHDELFLYSDDRVFINYDVVKKIDPNRSGEFQPIWNDFQYFADLAYWVQREVEKAVKNLFNRYHSLKPMDNVVYSGGLALNAVLNGQLKKDTKFKNFYFQPAAGDNGLAIGCCYYGWLEIMKKEKVKHNKSTYFGKVYAADEILQTLQRYEDKINYTKSKTFIEDTAKELANGKVVAWYQNESEFGPRALGNRSILADPRVPEMRDYINKEIKLREEFRPFAPSVLYEDCDKYFKLDFEKSPYMIIVGQTKEEWRDKIPSVVHLDGSARIQTVHPEINYRYYKLINSFKELTGIGYC